MSPSSPPEASNSDRTLHFSPRSNPSSQTFPPSQIQPARSSASCSTRRTVLLSASSAQCLPSLTSSLPQRTTSGILSHDTRIAELEEWCMAAIYALSRGSLRFRGLARAAGVDRALRRVADEGTAGGVRREMARKTLHAMRGDLDEEADLSGSSLDCGNGDDCGGSIVSDGLMSFRCRRRELGASSGGNTIEF